MITATRISSARDLNPLAVRGSDAVVPTGSADVSSDGVWRLPQGVDRQPRGHGDSPPPQRVDAAMHVLILDSHVPDIELIEHVLREAGLDFSHVAVDSRVAFEAELARQAPDLIVSDHSVPGFDGVDALMLARKVAPETPFIFVTGVYGEEVAIDLLKLGATDYVLKTHLGRLGPSVRRALREGEERRDRERTEARLHSSHQQLRALANHLHTVREEERARIALQVHDDLGQALTGLKLDLSWLSGKLRGSVELQGKIKGMTAHIDETISTVRRIATDLRPGVLDTLGLVAAIEWQAGDFQRCTGIPCETSVDLMETQLEPHFTTVCFRIFQETLTNIIRHAEATRVEVRLTENEGYLVLSVRDNGRGISERNITARSIGLIGMQERVAQVGGKVFFFGLPSFGTTVTMRVPMPATVAPVGEGEFRR